MESEIIKTAKDSTDDIFDRFIKHAMCAWPEDWGTYTDILEGKVTSENHLYARELWRRGTPRLVLDEVLKVSGESYDPQRDIAALDIVKKRLHERVMPIMELESKIPYVDSRLGYRRLRRRSPAEKLRHHLLHVVPKEEFARTIASVIANDDLDWFKVRRVLMGKDKNEAIISRVISEMNTILEVLVENFTKEKVSTKREYETLILTAESAVAALLGMSVMEMSFHN